MLTDSDDGEDGYALATGNVGLLHMLQQMQAQHPNQMIMGPNGAVMSAADLLGALFAHHEHQAAGNGGDDSDDGGEGDGS